VFEGGIVVGTDSGRVLCLSPDGQKQLWTYEQVEEKSMVYSSPAVSEGIVVVGARDRQVHGIDAKTGQRKWAFKTRGDVESSPAISGGRVYVGSRDKKLYVLDLKTGEKLWEFTTGRSIVASPAVGRGVVVIGDGDGALYCLEPEKN
jgi:outer membrane protein assembly factor BamB